MVALCDRKPTKIDSPQKREVRDKLYQRHHWEVVGPNPL